jgi:hypothetical protein
MVYTAILNLIDLGVKMKQKICKLLAFGCWAACLIGPLLALYLLWDLPLLMKLLKDSPEVRQIQWGTVVYWQKLAVWGVMSFNLAITLLALYFLRPVLLQFAQGAFFNYANSLNLRRFSWVLVFQGILHPLGFITLLLSWNHPAGQRLVSLSFSGEEIRFLALGFLFLLVSDLLVKGAELELENGQFI